MTSWSQLPLPHGGPGQLARFARRIGYRTHAADVARALQCLVLGYVDDRDESETFSRGSHAWVMRT
jgi:hypothetical protein